MGLVTVFSFSTWENTFPLGQFETFANKTPFDLIDYLVTNILMPLGGMFYALFAGWWLSRETILSEIGLKDGAIFKMWMILIRVVAPLAVALVFYFNLS
jgi:NSS family neurotransmitter:Na+ symporter